MPENPEWLYQDTSSPIGRLRLIAAGDDLVGIWFEHGRDARREARELVAGD